ncbi:DNA-binding protein [Aquibacillus rhizosphaerae]|uniref:DNA-binding protein n=1 Tax=Aquibacillus rhizosphaerae TaxID=3051431 RepID=A0ABT7KZK9_9BACI|nr:DNA-binding protein [Aquibacillus sp. LR5S19]MDL4838904.1 DNA-binding protein [Aquibacillus sp. LR5S19]
MSISFFWIAIGLAACGYFVGEGLKNFGNPNSSNSLNSLLDDEEDKPLLIKEKELNHYLGIDKEDVEAFVQNYPDIPRFELNGKTYYPYKKVLKWIDNRLI